MVINRIRKTKVYLQYHESEQACIYYLLFHYSYFNFLNPFSYWQYVLHKICLDLLHLHFVCVGYPSLRQCYSCQAITASTVKYVTLNLPHELRCFQEYSQSSKLQARVSKCVRVSVDRFM